MIARWTLLVNWMQQEIGDTGVALCIWYRVPSIPLQGEMKLGLQAQFKRGEGNLASGLYRSIVWAGIVLDPFYCSDLWLLILNLPNRPFPHCQDPPDPAELGLRRLLQPAAPRQQDELPAPGCHRAQGQEARPQCRESLASPCQGRKYLEKPKA